MQRQRLLTETSDIFAAAREERSIPEQDQQSPQVSHVQNRLLRVCWFLQQLYKPVGFVVTQIIGQLVLFTALLRLLPKHGALYEIAPRVAILWIIFSVAYQVSVVPNPAVRRTAIVIGNLFSATLAILFLAQGKSHTPLWWGKCFLIVATILCAQLVISEIYAARWKKRKEKPSVPFWLR